VEKLRPRLIREAAARQIKAGDMNIAELLRPRLIREAAASLFVPLGI
jgi:hypothetical protein